MRRKRLLIALLLAAALAACGGQPQIAPSARASTPAPISGISPPAAFVGGSPPTITVATTAVGSGARQIDVAVNGTILPTSDSTGFPVATIPASYLAATGVLKVTVEDAIAQVASAPFPFYVLPAAQAGAGVKLLISANLKGQPDDGQNNSAPAISATGRYVAFQSQADDLVPGPASGYADIYVRDTCLGAPSPCTPGTVRASVSTSGALANGHSYDPAISADGRYVAFDSNATNLAPGVPSPSPAVHAVYLRDTCIGVASGCTPSTILVSVTPSGAFANGDEPSLSASGRYVVMSGAPALVGLGGPTQVVLRDTCIGAVAPCSPASELASASSGGQPADSGGAYYPRVSPDGRYVAFNSGADNLAADATNNMPHIYLRDTCIGAPAGCTPSTILIDRGPSGQPANGNGDSNIDLPAVSTGGRYVAFSSAANVTNLGGAPNHGDLYLRDTCIGAPSGCTPSTIVISVPFSGQYSNSGSDSASITPDGRYVAFASLATNLVLDDPGPPGNDKDIFVRDTCIGAAAPCAPVTIWASVAQVPGDPYIPSLSACAYPALSADGHYVAYISDSISYGPTLGLTQGSQFAQVYLAATGF